MQSYYLFPCRQLDELTYEKLADETLDELASFFEDLGDSGLCHKDYDTQFSVSNLTPRPFLGPGLWMRLYSVRMMLLFWYSLWFSAIDTIGMWSLGTFLCGRLYFLFPFLLFSLCVYKETDSCFFLAKFLPSCLLSLFAEWCTDYQLRRYMHTIYLWIVLIYVECVISI